MSLAFLSKADDYIELVNKIYHVNRANFSKKYQLVFQKRFHNKAMRPLASRRRYKLKTGEGKRKFKTLKSYCKKWGAWPTCSCVDSRAVDWKL